MMGENFKSGSLDGTSGMGFLCIFLMKVEYLLKRGSLEKGLWEP